LIKIATVLHHKTNGAASSNNTRQNCAYHKRQHDNVSFVARSPSHKQTTYHFFVLRILIRMTMSSDNEKATASNPEISEKEEEVQDEKEPDEESKATPGSSSNIEPAAESIEDSGPEPHEEATPHDKVDPTGEEEKKPAEEEDTRQTLAQASPAPAAKSPSPKNKKKSEQHSEHSVEGDDMEDDRDDPHDDGDDKSSDSGKGGGNKDDFRIPTRYTKSGRRRATPFPLKVRTI
jgi:outer membrane biosynthesis protein TonB